MKNNAYLFGDSTFNVGEGLHCLLREEGNPFTHSFLRTSYGILQEEVNGLVSSLRVTFPRFNSIQDLVTQARQEALHPALHKALVCIFQLAGSISCCEDADDMFSRPRNTCVIGLCTGALAATAVSCSHNVFDLLELGSWTVRVAFRTAVHAYEVGKTIDQTSSFPWAITVTNMEEQEVQQLVKDFCSDKILPITSRPYLSLVAEHCITISGPPSTLQDLQMSKLAGHRVVKIGLHAPYHAQHLFTAEDVESILSILPVSYKSTKISHLPVISSATGAVKPACDFYTSLYSAVEDILINPIIWEDVLNGIAYISRFSCANMISIRAMASTSANHLANGLKKRGYTVEKHECQLGSMFARPQPYAAPLFPRQARTSMSGKAKIAIVGMSGRFPEADNLDAFWSILSQGLDVHTTVPLTRWNVATHVDPEGSHKNTSRTPYGCWLRNPGHFDAPFFNTTPREAFQIDPASRLALMTAYEAMEGAGLVPGSTPSTQKHRIGVAYGVTSNDWMEVNSAQNIDTFFIPGGCRAFIPGRINYVFNLSGPSYSLDTACSSSLSAIHTACNAIWQDDVDTMIAGGTNILTNPDYTAGLDRGHFLSRTGNCKSFDQTADGYCRAEGVCSIILKRLDDAIAENDPILGVILGAYTNHSAEAESITRPLVDAQQQVFRKIMNDTSVNPSDISYVEMHGTGTPVGDPIEMESVVSMFAPAKETGRARDSDKPLYVGAVKSNVGHGEAAAGVTSLAKVLLMMKHNLIPPHAGLRTKLNDKFPPDLIERNVHIARQPVVWNSQGTRRKAFVNNFSAAGGNTALLIEEAPVHTIQDCKDPRSTHVVTVSAKSRSSLSRNIESLRAFLGGHSQPPDGLSLSALSYTTTARRFHHRYRLAVHGTSLSQIEQELAQALEGVQSLNRVSGTPRIIFAFTGNGSQYAGMGHELYQNSPSFRESLRRLDRIVQRQGFHTILPICSGVAESLETKNDVSVQLATLCLELALSHLWMAWGIKPSCTIGHSLGEYTALAVAGVLSEADAIYLVGRRAQLLQEKCQKNTHSLLAIRAGLELVESCLSTRNCDIACINGPDDVVIGGAIGEIAEVREELRQQDIKTTLLSTPYAFHSAQVDPILDGLETVSEGVTFHRPSLPVLSPLLGSIISEAGTFSPRYMRQHCRQTVNMAKILRNSRVAGVFDDRAVVLEIGPSPLICGMVQNTLGPAMLTIASLKRGHDSHAVLAQSVAYLYNLGCNFDWTEYQSDFPMSHQVIQLPTYSWDLKDYWIQYVNDWSLRKGDPIPIPKSLRPPAPFNELAADPYLLPAAVQADVLPRLESTTIHKVLQDNLSGTGAVVTVVVETDLSRQDISPLAQGHKVNNISLATPSIYAEIALRVGQHIIDKYRTSLKGTLASVNNMTVERALVAHGGTTPQILRSTVEFDSQAAVAKCHFETFDTKTKNLRRHSHCSIEFIDKVKALETLRDRCLPSVTSRVEALAAGVSTGGSYRFSKSMIYKIVGSLAKFDSDYRQVDEIVLKSDAFEASSKVSFSGLSPGGSFHTNPAAIDALSQSAGFIMNGNDAANLDKEVFVNHGWTTFQLFQPISTSRSYTTHCAMSEGPKKRWEGDCIVFDGHEIIAWFGGINLQGVPRRTLSYILANEAGVRTMPTVSKSSSGSGVHHQTERLVELSPELEIHISSERSQARVMQDSNSVRSVRSPSLLAPILAAAPPCASQDASQSGLHVRQVMRILSEETGISESELSDDSHLVDLGIDSLLMLQLSSRLSEEEGIVFACPDFACVRTVKDLCDFVSAACRTKTSNILSSTPFKLAALIQPISTFENLDAPATQNEFKSFEGKQQIYKASSSQNLLQYLDNESDRSSSHCESNIVERNNILVTKALLVISEETGVPIHELTDNIDFADLGVDSLLSLMILSRYRDELGLNELDSSNSPFFIRCNTVGHLKQFIRSTANERSQPPESPPTISSTASAMSSTTLNTSSSPASSGEIAVPSISRSTEAVSSKTPKLARPATSLILQGKPRSDPYVLFLFPDGSGSATSYTGMSAVRSDLAIVALNCPYYQHPLEMENIKLDAVMKSYLDEVRRRQPQGPYRLGGWSAGGILAFRAAQMLIQDGDQVETLVLIDSPPPIGLDPLPTRWYEHCAKANLFGNMPGIAAPVGTTSRGSTLPQNLIPHFRAQVKLLEHYHAEPLPEGFTPRTSILWAGACVFDGRCGRPIFKMQPGDPEGIKFLTQSRTDWTSGAWKQFFPHDEPSVSIMTGEDHFSMMQHEAGDKLADFVSLAAI